VRFGPLLAVTPLILAAILSIAACIPAHPDSTVEANPATVVSPSTVPSQTTDGCVEGYYRSGNYCLKNEIPF
jgi:hypothetical protein